MAKWTTSNIPPQFGRSIVITGTGGLGFECALALGKVGGSIILAGRNPQKGAQAVADIKARAPSADVRFEILDLADLKSISDFSGRLRRLYDSLDILINNAGIMVPPKRQTTADGFELQLGTNYLGHFALTAGLLPLLHKGIDARVVTLSSVAARSGKIDFADLQAERRYAPMSVYSQSKLACLMFALELQRKSEANGWGVSSIGAHPGVARTDLLTNAPGSNSIHAITRRHLWFLFQPAAQGALPALYAATSPEVKGGGYYGPDKLGEIRGYPAVAKIPATAMDRAVCERLWSLSEQLTGFGSELST